jgi:hypothetical protein
MRLGVEHQVAHRIRVRRFAADGSDQALAGGAVEDLDPVSCDRIVHIDRLADDQLF